MIVVVSQCSYSVLAHCGSVLQHCENAVTVFLTCCDVDAELPTFMSLVGADLN